jgi:hypothetical protein
MNSKAAVGGLLELVRWQGAPPVRVVMVSEHPSREVEATALKNTETTL